MQAGPGLPAAPAPRDGGGRRRWEVLARREPPRPPTAPPGTKTRFSVQQRRAASEQGVPRRQAEDRPPNACCSHRRFCRTFEHWVLIKHIPAPARSFPLSAHGCALGRGSGNAAFGAEKYPPCARMVLLLGTVLALPGPGKYRGQRRRPGQGQHAGLPAAPPGRPLRLRQGFRPQLRALHAAPQFSFCCCRAFRCDGAFLVKCQARGRFPSLVPSQVLRHPHGGGRGGMGTALMSLGGGQQHLPCAGHLSVPPAMTRPRAELQNVAVSQQSQELREQPCRGDRCPEAPSAPARSDPSSPRHWRLRAGDAPGGPGHFPAAVPCPARRCGGSAASLGSRHKLGSVPLLKKALT